MSTGGLEALGAGDALAAANALSCPAESYSNDPLLEIAWATKAYEFSEIHYNLISSAEPEFLHLTEHDDEIYNEFRRSFPTMMIAILNPEDLKSESSKKKWRAFCLLFDGKVAEFNFGTLLRLNATAEYSEENTIFGHGCKNDMKDKDMRVQREPFQFHLWKLRKFDMDSIKAEFFQLATRIQFYAIEIARNREGHNTPLWARTTEASKDGDTTTLSDDVQRSV